MNNKQQNLITRTRLEIDRQAVLLKTLKVIYIWLTIMFKCSNDLCNKCYFSFHLIDYTVQQIFNFEKIQEQVIEYFVNSGALIPNSGLFFYVHVKIL